MASVRGNPIMVRGERSTLTLKLEQCLRRLQAGEHQARDELLAAASSRLLALTRRMARDFRRLARWEQTEDVCQNACLRLWNALRSVQPASVVDFHRLAATQIRRELIDLARRHYGPEGLGANHASRSPNSSSDASPPVYDRAESTVQPERIAAWTEFHAQVDALPDEPREVFDLLWYQGLSQPEAAALLGVSEPTIRRRWRAARLELARKLGGEPPP